MGLNPCSLDRKDCPAQSQRLPAAGRLSMTKQLGYGIEGLIIL